MPGYTHFQVAQPISLAHHCLAYVEMLGRDRGRLADCLNRLNQNPLGAGALAGTAFPINRQMTTKLLKFTFLKILSQLNSNMTISENSKRSKSSLVFKLPVHNG